MHSMKARIRVRVVILFVLLLASAVGGGGCLTLRTARSLSQGQWAVRAQTSPLAPPPFLGALSVSRGMIEGGELGGGFAFLAGARDEPGVDLEWFQQLGSPLLPWSPALLPGLEAGLGMGVGGYVIDPGLFLHTTQAFSLNRGGWSPLLLHRLTLDLDARTRQELYMGAELFSGKRLRFYLAGGSRDLWNRDQWVVVFGGGLHLGGRR